MNELAQFVYDYLYDNRIKKTEIAENLGITRQKITQLLNKKNFGINDANYLLNSVNKRIEYTIIDKISESDE